MQIIFDLYSAQPIGNTKFHGGGEYIKTIFKYLLDNYLNMCNIVVFYDYEKFLDDWIVELLKNNKIKSYDVKSYKEIATLVEKSDADVFYSGLAYGYNEVNINSSVTRVGTVHGLRALEAPCDKYTASYGNSGILRYLKDVIKYNICKNPGNIFEKKELKKYINMLSNFDKIITVSYHSRYALQCWLPLKKPVRVFYSPIKYVENLSDYNENLSLPTKYLMLMGGNRWIKNTARCIKAVEEILDTAKLSEYYVVVCGKLPERIRRLIKHLERYILFDYLSPAALETVYKNCDIFLYLTLNEGFGAPPLEAMMYGKTVITSPICSLPEIYGDSVYYANPYDIKEIQNRIFQAVDRKISESIIREKVTIIRNRQIEDLKGLCDFIVGKE